MYSRTQKIPYWRVFRSTYNYYNYFHSKEICAYTQDALNKECLFECKYIERCSITYTYVCELVDTERGREEESVPCGL